MLLNGFSLTNPDVSGAVPSIEITYVASTEGQNSVAQPAGTLVGDIMVWLGGYDTAAAGPCQLPPDFTRIDHLESSYASTVSGYRIVDGNETTPFLAGSFITGATILTFRKSGGSWTVPTTENLHSVNDEDNVGAVISTASVTPVSVSDILVCSFMNDGGDAISVGPPDMTLRKTSTFSSWRVSTYSMVAGQTAPITKEVTYSATDNRCAYAIILNAG